MLTRQRLKEVLRYEPRSGKFYWRVSLGPRAQEGNEAGYTASTGYIVIGVDGERYLAHRLAVLYRTGKWPKDETDHRNRKRHDNRWTNLREATRRQNIRNQIARAPSGLKNIYKARNRWRVLLNVDGKLKSFGSFSNLRAAKLVRNMWVKQHYEGF